MCQRLLNTIEGIISFDPLRKVVREVLLLSAFYRSRH